MGTRNSVEEQPYIGPCDVVFSSVARAALIMILDPDAYPKALQLVRSRNREVIGRKSGFIIDIYMSKGQCIARLWPVDQLYEPSEKYLKTQNAVIREREIEKRMSIDDLVALKLRTVQSRFNWWEMLGKIHISREYHLPGSTCGIYLKSYVFQQPRYTIVFETDRDACCRFEMVHRDNYPRPGHYWYYSKHREAGLENTLRGSEAFLPDKFLKPWKPGTTLRTHTFRFAHNYLPIGSVWIVRAYKEDHFANIIGESGVFYLDRVRPWYLNAPLSV